MNPLLLYYLNIEFPGTITMIIKRTDLDDRGRLLTSTY